PRNPPLDGTPHRALQLQLHPRPLSRRHPLHVARGAHAHAADPSRIARRPLTPSSRSLRASMPPASIAMEPTAPPRHINRSTPAASESETLNRSAIITTKREPDAT